MSRENFDKKKYKTKRKNMWIRRFYRDLFKKRFWVNEVTVLKETEKAILLKFCDQKEWYPKSKIFKVDKEKKRVKVDDFWLRKFA